MARKKPEKDTTLQLVDEDEGGQGSQSGGSAHQGDYRAIWGGGYGEPGFPTIPDGRETFLVDETKAMENERRLQEQRGHRKFARTITRDRVDEPDNSQGNELSMQEGPKDHPFLQSQRFDGVDPNVSPAPEIGTEARREFDNEKREQDKEKQLRLGNQLQNKNEYQARPSSAPTMKPR
jgi:hypothetical protein